MQNIYYYCNNPYIDSPCLHHHLYNVLTQESDHVDTIILSICPHPGPWGSPCRAIVLLVCFGSKLCNDCPYLNEMKILFCLEPLHFILVRMVAQQPPNFQTQNEIEEIEKQTLILNLLLGTSSVQSERTS